MNDAAYASNTLDTMYVIVAKNKAPMAAGIVNEATCKIGIIINIRITGTKYERKSHAHVDIQYIPLVIPEALSNCRTLF